MTTGYDKKRLRLLVSLMLVIALLSFSTLMVLMSPAAHAKEYIPPVQEFSTNYYDGYGEPDIYASVLGDTEFERGETGQISVVLSNKGVLYGFKAASSVGTNEALHQLSLAELQYESQRTVAYGIKAELLSPFDFIEVDAQSSVGTLKKLYPGVLPDNPLTYTVTISGNAPAGDYFLMLPVNYEFQDEIEMTAGSTTALGLTELDHTTYYSTANKTIPIPVTIKEDVKFEVTDVSGKLTEGQTSRINVTYKNTGEITATDAIARVVVMKPLSVDRSVISLGDIAPGESVSVSYDVTAELMSVEKNYGIDSEIKYLDEDDEVEFSENMKINVALDAREANLNIGMLAFIGIIIVILVAAGRSVLGRRKDK